MKYSELICEDDPKNITHIVTEITTKCQPFLKKISYETSDYLIFRGLGIYTPQLYDTKGELITAPGFNPNRYPKDTPRYLHKELNHIFTHLFKFPFRNGTFVTSNSDMAKDYGNVVLIIPIGEFHYLWSPHVKDLFEDWDEFESGEIFNAKQKGDPSPNIEDMCNKYLELMERNVMQYRTINLKDAIESGNEIMIYCDRYFVFPHKNLAVMTALKQIQKNHVTKNNKLPL